MGRWLPHNAASPAEGSPSPRPVSLLINPLGGQGLMNEAAGGAPGSRAAGGLGRDALVLPGMPKEGLLGKTPWAVLSPEWRSIAQTGCSPQGLAPTVCMLGERRCTGMRTTKPCSVSHSSSLVSSPLQTAHPRAGPWRAWGAAWLCPWPRWSDTGRPARVGLGGSQSWSAWACSMHRPQSCGAAPRPPGGLRSGCLGHCWLNWASGSPQKA